MSHVVTGVVQRRKVGSPTRKAILMYMAGCASDDGSGVWTSKGNMARDLEMAKRTVQNGIEELLAMGLISEVGHRKCENGFTVEYCVQMDAVLALPGTRKITPTRAGDAPVQEVHPCTPCTPTRAGDAPLPVQEMHPNRPRNHPKNHNDQSDFENFWSLCPRKVGKGQARKAYAAALKKVGAKDLEAGMRRYASEQKARGTAVEFIAHPATWLTGERWADEAAPPPTQKAAPQNYLDFYRQKYGITKGGQQ